jgi:hypothetical protein
MNSEQINVAKECAALSAAGKIHFGEVVSRLLNAGIERYHADYSRTENTYYTPDGTCRSRRSFRRRESRRLCAWRSEERSCIRNSHARCWRPAVWATLSKSLESASSTSDTMGQFTRNGSLARSESEPATNIERLHLPSLEVPPGRAGHVAQFPGHADDGSWARPPVVATGWPKRGRRSWLSVRLFVGGGPMR